MFKKVIFSTNRAWLFFSLLKVVYMFMAVLVVSHYIPLGDTHAYLNSSHSGEGRPNFLLSSTMMMDFVAGKLNNILGYTLANLPFTLLSVFGVYYAIKRILLTQK